MSPEEHRQRHVELHKALDELAADFISDEVNKGRLFSTTTIMELVQWSHQQTKHPSVLEAEAERV